MSVSISGSQITFNDASTQNTAATGFGFKNRIINGAMMIDQRNAGASVTPNNSYTLDRWLAINSQTGKFTVQQNAGSVTPPVGFSNYLGVTSTSAYSIGANDYFGIVQYIEGFNVADLAWGTASAATVTLSFWVRSSLTGTFGGTLNNSANTQNYPFTYTINSANTWEQKSITITGSTTATWVTNNGIGLMLRLGLGVGSTYSGTAGSWSATQYLSAAGATSVVGTNGATFYITGVQLEKGSTATSFDYRPYGTEEFLCKRYYQVIGAGCIGRWYASNAAQIEVQYPVTMRSAPSVGGYSQTVGFVVMGVGTGTTTSFSPVIANGVTTTGADLYITTNTVATAGNMATFTTNGIALISEL